MNNTPQTLAVELLKLVDPGATVPPSAVHWEALSGGKNNRSFRIIYSGKYFFLKHYFTSPHDRRDRRKTEAVFLNHCKLCKISVVPRLLASSQDLQASLLSYISGNPFAPETSIQREHVSAALGFFNQLQQVEPVSEMGNASEANWGLSGHLERARSRLQRLKKGVGGTATDRDMISFVNEILATEWSKLHHQIRESSESLHEDRYFERIISPSDFGFHNALQSPEGSLTFLDFEYAGWDDPAKTILDFFFQPRFRVPSEFFPYFRDGVLKHTRYYEIHARRVALLAPVFRIVWISTLLNEFLEGGQERRVFSSSLGREVISKDEFEQRKALQLEKARLLLSKDLSYMT